MTQDKRILVISNQPPRKGQRELTAEDILKRFAQRQKEKQHEARDNRSII